jgi:outer membrane immunogenic protein
MTRTLLAALACVTIGAASAPVSSAADFPTKAPIRPPAQVIAYNWSGFYIGAHVGGGWGPKDWSDPTGDFFNGTPRFPLGSHDVSGVLAGGQIGFNWQFPGSNWVLGIEGQASWSNLKGDHIYDGDEGFQTKVNWLATVAGRVGYAWDRLLVYAKGGVAFADEKFTHFDTDDPGIFFKDDQTRTGWMVGGGLEVALGGNWSAKGEYNYMDFGKKSVLFDPFASGLIPFDIDQQIHVFKFGFNYRFGR